jgi:hypothetical protein
VRKPVFPSLFVLACFTASAAAQPAPPPAGPPASEVAPVVSEETPSAVPAPAAVVPAASFAPGAAPSTFGRPSQSEPASPPRSEALTGRKLSEGVALGLSLGATLASWSLIVFNVSDARGETLATIGLVGAFLGPSVGHWYRGAPLTRGMLPRAAGIAAVLTGLVLSRDCEWESCTSREYMILGGIAAYLAGTIDDIVTAPLRVREHNRRLSEVSLTPMVTPRGGGIAFGGRF